MIVVDASVLAVALVDDEDEGSRVRARLADEQLVAPELIDLEVTSMLRRRTLAGRLEPSRAELALSELSTLQLERVPHRDLLERVWQLRENVTSYDASYVAVAEALGVALLTGDQRLAAAPGIQCPVEVLAPS